MSELDGPNTRVGGLFVCPQCRNRLLKQPESFRCVDCGKEYPVIFGIADFRIRSDRYLSLEEERAKARRLATEVEQSFSAMLDYYYDITDDVPPVLAARYKAYHYNSPRQARYSLERLGIASDDVILDVGCGTGGALIAAAEKGSQVYGMDIALRWLMICQQRLREQGISATLVCADIEASPFPDGSFSKIVATDLLENVYSVEKSLSAMGRLLKADGKLWLAGSNKFCLGPHPSTRLWAIGYFPGKWRRRLVTGLRGVDSLRFINLISPARIIRYAKRIGLHVNMLSPRMVALDGEGTYPAIDRVMIKIYVAVARLPLLRQLLIWIGPAFEMALQKAPHSKESKGVDQA
ncbi:class I SAM-dependent methyltransferase [Marinobacter sp. TBZ242]|uniref:Class I SAM-dependent methyltransferase n=1 Tax=Marinobacter azerbaijanicus TaxID=3050455 RepID=A0ABT7I6M4_9GAMM|nr:class I SAM-dependent methyltransferase [Marinobacter sp. TBZ242]MDL0429774.1 class I SAM-dependent methyltransferase [Marinobacter sp. TBZ242]